MNKSRSIVKINAYTGDHKISPILISHICRENEEEAWLDAKNDSPQSARKSKYQQNILVIQSVGVRRGSSTNCNWTVEAA